MCLEAPCHIVEAEKEKVGIGWHQDRMIIQGSRPVRTSDGWTLPDQAIRLVSSDDEVKCLNISDEDGGERERSESWRSE